MNSITDLFQRENEYYDGQHAPGFVQGTVVENNNAEYKGMVKVEFTVWESGKNMCEWVRLLAPYTGKDYGTYWVPEIDETVLVGFIGGSLKRPFLLGSLYPSGASLVSENFDKKNVKKRVKTKGGVDIAISDEDGKQSITVTTPKGSTLVIDDEKQCCKLSDKEGKNGIQLDYKNGKAELLAEKTISIKAGSVELSLDGQYALTNAAGQTLRYFDLLQYDGTMPVEKTHLNGGEAAYSASLCVPRTETLTVEVTDGSLFSASWEDERQFRQIEGSVRKIVLSDKTTSVEAAGEAYTLTARMPGDNGNRLIVSTAGDLTLTQKGENLLRGDAEYTCTLKNGNGDIVAEQTYPAGAEARISLERGTLSDNG